MSRAEFAKGAKYEQPVISTEGKNLAFYKSGKPPVSMFVAPRRLVQTKGRHAGAGRHPSWFAEIGRYEDGFRRGPE
jgi:hypothetical protein